MWFINKLRSFRKNKKPETDIRDMDNPRVYVALHARMGNWSVLLFRTVLFFNWKETLDPAGLIHPSGKSFVYPYLVGKCTKIHFSEKKDNALLVYNLRSFNNFFWHCWYLEYSCSSSSTWFMLNLCKTNMSYLQYFRVSFRLLWKWVFWEMLSSYLWRRLSVVMQLSRKRMPLC